MAATAPAPTPSFLRLVNQGLTVIIGIISRFVLDVIEVKPNRNEISIIVFLVFLLWAGMYRYIYNTLRTAEYLQTNVVWRSTLLGVLDFTILLGIFLVLQLLLAAIKTPIILSSFSLFETLIGIFAVVMIGYSIVQTIKIYT